MTILTKSALAAILAVAFVSAAEAQQVTRQIEILPAPTQVAANIAAPQAAAPATDGANIPAPPQEAAPAPAAPPAAAAPAAPAPKAEPNGEQKFVAPKFAEQKPFHGEYGYRHAYGYGSGYGYARRAPHCH